ncbi:uncharacterized protein TNCV_502411 [Trichonephila clavipes]|nr:uncharacterized protein TNCV_502411 [Trichonephila clavipes]
MNIGGKSVSKTVSSTVLNVPVRKAAMEIPMEVECFSIDDWPKRLKAKTNRVGAGSSTGSLKTTYWAVGKNATNYNGEVSAVYESTTQLLAAGLAPAKVVFFIDSQAAISALSSNTPTDCLNTIQCRTKIAELISYGGAGLWPYSQAGDTMS